MRKLLIISALMILVLPAVFSLTANIGNAKAIIRVNASPDDPAIIPRTIEANNLNDIPVLITLTPNVEAEKFVEIIDDEFVLQPGESKDAELVLTIDRGGQIDILINVAFRSADPEVKENPVGLTSKIIVMSQGPIIEEPVEEPEEELEEETEETEEVDGTEEDEEEVEEPEEETEEETTPEETEETEEEQEETEEITDSKPNPLVGLLIVVIVVVVGLIVFFAITSMNK